MDVSIKFESWRENVKRAIPHETLLKKVLIIFGGLITLVSSIVLGTYQMKQWKNVLVIQNNFGLRPDNYTKTLWENSTFYDIQFINQTYTDDQAAKDLKLQINATCDYDCQKQGCNWSMIYILAGFVLILLAANAILLVVGGFFYRSRMIGVFCHGCLTIFSVISVCMTYKWRYGDMGKLAAMSTFHSRTISDTEYDKNWTYEDDGKLIVKLLWAQAITAIICLITSFFGCCVSKNDNLIGSQISTRKSETNQLLGRNQH